MALRKQDIDDQETDIPMKRSRLTIDVSPELRRRIKMAAFQNDLSVSEYLGNILEEEVPQEASVDRQSGHPVTQEAIERLNRLRALIAKENTTGEPFIGRLAEAF